MPIMCQPIDTYGDIPSFQPIIMQVDIRQYSCCAAISLCMNVCSICMQCHMAMSECLQDMSFMSVLRGGNTFLENSSFWVKIYLSEIGHVKYMKDIRGQHSYIGFYAATAHNFMV